MIQTRVLTDQQRIYLRAAVEHPSGIKLALAGPWKRAVFTGLANLGLVMFEKRAGLKRLGSGVFVVEETWVIATPRGRAAMSHER